MRITIEFAPGASSREITPTRFEYEGVGGFCMSYMDGASDGKPMYTGLTAPAVGLMMVNTMRDFWRNDVPRDGLAAPSPYYNVRTTLVVEPVTDAEKKNFSEASSESDEGLVFIDTGECLPVVHGWLAAGSEVALLVELDWAAWDMLLASHLSKIEWALRSLHLTECAYKASRTALVDHMQWMAEQDANAEMMAAATADPKGVHVLGKGLPKRLRGR